MPDSLEVAANKIAVRAADLKLKKFDIGTPVGILQQAGYGGYYQDFSMEGSTPITPWVLSKYMAASYRNSFPARAWM